MTSPPFMEARSTSTLIRVLTVCLVAFDLLIIVLAATNLNKSRQQQVERAEMATHNLAQVLEQNLLATVRQIDLVLLSIKDEAERRDLPDPKKQVAEHIQEQFTRVGILGGIRTVNAQGIIDRGTALPPGPLLSVVDREYFQHLKAHPEAGLYVSRPLIGRITGHWLVIFARRLNLPDGGFAGLVFGQISLEELSRNLSQVDVGSHGSISLRGEDLSLLARYPLLPGAEQLIGDRRVTGDYLQAVRANRAVTHFTAGSILDGSVRTYTLRRMTEAPFYILVGLSQGDYLATWRRDALLTMVTVAGLLLLSVLIVWIARQAWRRQLADGARLAHQEAKYRLLAENALDVIWTSDAEGLLTYVSPSLHRRGLLPPEITGIESGSHLVLGHIQDPLWPRLSGVKALPPGSQPFEYEVLELAMPTQEGPTLQAEVRVRVLWDEGGALIGFQGVTRDITQRKAAEQALQQALEEVRTLGGMLPICSHCKKIRDDQGYWKQIEAYISAHSEATFTHGICPDCAATHFPKKDKGLPEA